MKRKAVSVLLGGVMIMAVCGGNVQAMTYGYDIGGGRAIYITEEYGDVGQNQEAAVEYHENADITKEEQKKWSDWHKEEMREQVAYLEIYGVSYDADEDAIYYKGKTVRWLIDEQVDGTYKAIQMPEGEIDLYTVRAEDYKLTGVRVATQEEYEERTRKDEAARLEMEAAGETAIMIEDIVSEALVDEQVESTYAVEGYYAEPEKKIREYRENGIDYDSKTGCWMWQGKMVYYLMDENGSICQNGSKEAKENKIYILVKRNGDGSVKEVKQITAEEVMEERILRDEKNN